MQKFYALVLLACLAFPVIQVKAQTPPATWQEHWFEHNQNVSRVYYDNDLALYFDSDVSTSVTWPRQYLGDVWRYTKKTYGSFGTDPHLFAILHTGKYSGGHPSTYFDASHDNRNVIDAGAGPWTSATQGDYNLLTHEVAHIVELGGKNMHNSPAFGIWGDSKWAEIFIYDVYKGLGLESRATSAYNDFTASRDDFPRANTAWFRDWFYPIYSQYGGAQVLNRYFTQLSLYFSRSGTNYNSMNMGEFVHFWSAAAGVNLKSLATNAFGWTSQYESQFIQAQQTYPFTYSTPPPIAVSLFQDINYGGYGVYLPVGSYNLAQLKAYGARNDDITSLKVAPGYKIVLYADDNFSGASTTVTSDVPLLDVATWNDKVSSVIISALSPAEKALAKEESTGINVFPNPSVSGGTLTVQVEKYDASKPVQVQLLDVNKKVAAFKKTNTQRVSLATSNIASGFYILVVTNGAKVYTKKVLIQ
ncbi:T9SS type A sorting domain-containing protein [Chitinophaga filiformis]|nr:T9SS type A sorting domain-containing protein [Chitinophaga filiformis]